MATVRQKEAFDKIHLEKKAPSVAMKEVGYQPSVSKNPKILTASRGYLELLEEYKGALDNVGLDAPSRAKKLKKLVNSKNEGISLGAIKHVDSVFLDKETSQSSEKTAPVVIKINKLEFKPNSSTDNVCCATQDDEEATEQPVIHDIDPIDPDTKSDNKSS